MIPRHHFQNETELLFGWARWDKAIGPRAVTVQPVKDNAPAGPAQSQILQ